MNNAVVIRDCRLEYHNSSENKHKFYEVQVLQAAPEEFIVTRRFGRVGSATKPKEVDRKPTIWLANVAADKLISAKEFSKKDRYTKLYDKTFTDRVEQPKKVKPEPVDQEIKIVEEKQPEADFWSSLNLT